YWGDVGPDARKDSSRGPKGHDEINQARKPGFFGWPLFIGNNKPYREVDFATQAYGDFYNPIIPVNNSPNNTGPQELPPAQSAFIWYPYVASKEFPVLGEGGRNAMAGPVYHTDQFAQAPNRFPDYYDGKLFIYDFMRDWVMLVTMNEAGDLEQIEPFLPQLNLSSPMDMIFDKEGALYILEYGTRWFATNEDARLIKIDYAAGNRAPISQLAADVSVGAAPLQVNFTSEGSMDHDKEDALTYQWDFGNGDKASGANVNYVYQEAGVYQPSLTVIDAAGASSEAQMEIRVGNQPPDIQIAIEGNQTFFWKERPLPYSIAVADLEDGSLADGKIPSEAVAISFDFLEGMDPTENEQGHAALAEASMIAAGEKLITESGCIACHGIEKAVVGPAYTDVSEKYAEKDDQLNYLTGKILNGGMGVWGGAAMPAQSQLSRDQASKMAAYILSLSKKGETPANLPASGTLMADQHNGFGEGASYTLRVSYTDQGGEIIGPLNAFQSLTLRSPKMEAESRQTRLSSTGTQRIRNVQPSGSCIDLQTNGYVGYEALDLTGLSTMTISYATNRSDVLLEIRADRPDGPVLSSQLLPKTGGNTRYTRLEMPLAAMEGYHDWYVVARNQNETEADGWRVRLDWIYFQPSELGN
ncbi:MAG: PKD domain-containing protein, partial [Bacteroidota bacterium]